MTKGVGGRRVVKTIRRDLQQPFLLTRYSLLNFSSRSFYLDLVFFFEKGAELNRALKWVKKISSIKSVIRFNGECMMSNLLSLDIVRHFMLLAGWKGSSVKLSHLRNLYWCVPNSNVHASLISSHSYMSEVKSKVLSYCVDDWHGM